MIDSLYWIYALFKSLLDVSANVLFSIDLSTSFWYLILLSEFLFDKESHLDLDSNLKTKGE